MSLYTKLHRSPFEVRNGVGYEWELALLPWLSGKRRLPTKECPVTTYVKDILSQSTKTTEAELLINIICQLTILNKT